MNRQEVISLAKKEKERLISLRSTREIEIKAFFKEVDRIKAEVPDLLADIEEPASRDPKELFPSLYEENIPREQFKEEDARFQAYIDAVEAKLNPYYEEAYRLLKEGVS